MNGDLYRLTTVSIALKVKPIWWAHFVLTPPKAPGNLLSKQWDKEITIPRPVIERGRRLMTLCLPSNRLFDNRTPLPVPLLHCFNIDTQCSNRKHGMWLHTWLCGRTRGRAGEWEPLIFIHDREKVVACWHRLLHLHAVIDCLPQPGSSVYLQIDEPVSLAPFPCHPVSPPWTTTLQHSVSLCSVLLYPFPGCCFCQYEGWGAKLPMLGWLC